MSTLFLILRPNKRSEFIFANIRDRPLEGFEGHEFKRIKGDKGKEIIAILDLRSGGIPSGYEIKNGLFGGVTNVLGYYSKKSRGVLLKEALLKSEDIDDMLEYMIRELKSGEYSAANYLISNGKKAFHIENFGEEIVVEETNKIALTNHFIHLKKGVFREESINRRKYIEEKLLRKGEVGIEDALNIARNHEPVAICRHGITLSSFIINSTEEIEVYYSLSYPCEGFRKEVLNKFNPYSKDPLI